MESYANYFTTSAIWQSVVSAIKSENLIFLAAMQIHPKKVVVTLKNNKFEFLFPQVNDVSGKVFFYFCNPLTIEFAINSEKANFLSATATQSVECLKSNLLDIETLATLIK